MSAERARAEFNATVVGDPERRTDRNHLGNKNAGGSPSPADWITACNRYSSWICWLSQRSMPMILMVSSWVSSQSTCSSSERIISCRIPLVV